MKLNISQGYGSITFKSADYNIELNYKDIESQVVILNGKEQGYIREVGKTRVVEHGYSADESIYALITLDYRVIPLDYDNYLEIV